MTIPVDLSFCPSQYINFESICWNDFSFNREELLLSSALLKSTRVHLLIGRFVNWYISKGANEISVVTRKTCRPACIKIIISDLNLLATNNRP